MEIHNFGLVKSKLAVYTAITGAYDEIPVHRVVCPDADYYCYVGKGEKREENSGPWKMVELDAPVSAPLERARYAKTHPEELLPGYEYTLWIDANIDVVQEEFFAVVRQKMDGNIPISGIWHPTTDCAYEEAVRVVQGGREKAFRALRILRFLRRNGLPRHFGLFETGVLLRHSGTDAAVRRLDDIWWSLISRFSRRDQLSFSYGMREAGLAWDTLLPAPANVRNHPFFSYRNHSRALLERGFLYRKTHGLLVALTRWYAER